MSNLILGLIGLIVFGLLIVCLTFLPTVQVKFILLACAVGVFLSLELLAIWFKEKS